MACEVCKQKDVKALFDEVEVPMAWHAVCMNGKRVPQHCTTQCIRLQRMWHALVNSSSLRVLLYMTCSQQVDETDRSDLFEAIDADGNGRIELGTVVDSVDDPLLSLRFVSLGGIKNAPSTSCLLYTSPSPRDRR
eukprot:4181121-Amphidinium_carterae.1